MPRTSRSGVISLADRATRIPTTTTRATAGNGAPCELRGAHCTTPWTVWTALGGRCTDHNTLTKGEIAGILASPRQPWVRGGSYSIAARTQPRGTPGDRPHPFAQDPGAGRGICHCGLGIRAQTHRARTHHATTDPQER